MFIGSSDVMVALHCSLDLDFGSSDLCLRKAMIGQKITPSISVHSGNKHPGAPRGLRGIEKIASWIKMHISCPKVLVNITEFTTFRL